MTIILNDFAEEHQPVGLAAALKRWNPRSCEAAHCITVHRISNPPDMEM